MKTSAQVLNLEPDPVQEAVVRLLEHMGEDPGRDGLRDTPLRVVRMWRELTEGYRQDPGELLSAVFQEENGEMVVLKGITFSSICEHHLLPFTGTAAVGYLPQGKIVGISKLARVVECFARRLQVQERMSREIAEAINDHLAPRGVGVFIRGHHSCMGCRGVEQPSSEMITLNLQGSFRSDPSVRDYFLTLVNS